MIVAFVGSVPPRNVSTKTRVGIIKPCNECAYFDKGKCKLYLYPDAEHCRKDVSLCGQDGKYFKTKK